MRKFLISYILIYIVPIGSSFAQNNHGTCASATISGNHTVVAGVQETYVHNYTAHVNEPVIWTITGAETVDGIPFTDFPNGQVEKNGTEIKIVWNDNGSPADISVFPKFPCSALNNIPQDKFPIIVSPGGAQVPDGGGGGPTTDQECDASVQETGVWRMWPANVSERNYVAFICDPSARVGIGTSYPQKNLDVARESQFRGNATFNGDLIRFSGGSDVEILGRISRPLQIGSLKPTNNTVHDDYMLSIDGKMICKTGVVTMENWSDFVFAPDYQLMSLDSLAHYITEQKHLPHIPSEQEVLTNGVDLGQMHARLLEKIEELTLYVIELKKENDRMQTRIDKLELENAQPKK